MIGRRAVVIWIATRRKITTQVAKPAVERACECEKPVTRNLRPKQVAINQKHKWSAPIQTMDSVDCENSQATGANPTSSVVMSMSKPATSPQISANRAREPLRQVKM